VKCRARIRSQSLRICPLFLHAPSSLPLFSTTVDVVIFNLCPPALVFALTSACAPNTSSLSFRCARSQLGFTCSRLQTINPAQEHGRSRETAYSPRLITSAYPSHLIYPTSIHRSRSQHHILSPPQQQDYHSTETVPSVAQSPCRSSSTAVPTMSIKRLAI